MTVRALNLFSAKADYSQIFWNNTGRIEAGAKAAVSVTHNVFNKYDYDPAHSTTAEDPKENDDFTYTEQVYAAYINVAKQFNDKWNAQLGLRGEARQQGHTADDTQRHALHHHKADVHAQLKGQ